jgi:uncharacterized membrane protein YagU involved in acid resistance
MAAGVLAGLAASWAMNQFQQLRAQNPPRPAADAGDPQGHDDPQERKQEQQALHQNPTDLDENATVKTAQRISRKLFEHELSDTEKQIAGPAVHYAYGAVVGGLYGGLAELLPITAAGLGMPFGFALWLLGDEIAVPALGLGKRPTEYSPEVHADALAAHFMYGVSTDMLRRVIKHVI